MKDHPEVFIGFGFVEPQVGAKCAVSCRHSEKHPVSTLAARMRELAQLIDESYAVLEETRGW